MPPADYIAQVCKVFGFRLEWLLFGQGPPKADDPEAEETQFQAALYGDLVKWAKDIDWAGGQLRIAVLRLLREARDTLDGTEEKQKAKDDAIATVASYLRDASSPDESWFVPLGELPPRQRQHVMMHLTAIVYLLFRPFREEEASFRRSKTLRGQRQKPTVRVGSRGEGRGDETKQGARKDQLGHGGPDAQD